MGNIFFWSLCGFYSFYFTGFLFGLSKQNMKNMAAIGFLLGCIRGYFGKGLLC